MVRTLHSGPFLILVNCLLQFFVVQDNQTSSLSISVCPRSIKTPVDAASFSVKRDVLPELILPVLLYIANGTGSRECVLVEIGVG
jgi:hypothetical protein